MSKADRPDQPGAAERFNEDQATYAVRGSDQPDLEIGVAAIREVLKTLPVRPGVYRMQDARGDVLYVGKARALKNRVDELHPGRQAAEAAAADGGADAVDDHRHHPHRGRGAAARGAADQALPAALQRAAARRQKLPVHPVCAKIIEFPRIQKHRGARRIKGQYYGPFASAGSVTRTLNALQKLFLLRSCSDSFFANRSRPCLLYQIKRCSAPCVGRIDDDRLWRTGRRGEGVPRRQVDRRPGAPVAIDGAKRPRSRITSSRPSIATACGR